MAYNVFNCNPRQLKEVLRMSYEVDIPLFIAGPPGIGKTDIVRQFVAEVGAKMPRPLIVSGYQPEDLFGVPVPNKETGYLDYHLLKVLPPHDSEESWVLFFDEMSNADKRMQAPLQQFFLHKQLGDYVAPKRCYLVAAGNNLEDGCHTYEMSRALEDRFCIVNLRPDIGSWVEWAVENQVHASIIAFLKAKPEYLHSTLMCEKHEVSEDDRVLPTPRAWGSYVNRYLSLPGYSRTAKEIAISGVVGSHIAAIFFRTVDELKDLPTPEYVLESVKSPRKEQLLKQLMPKNSVGTWSLCFSLLAYCQTNEHYEGLATFLEFLGRQTDSGQPVREIVSLTMERALAASRRQKSVSRIQMVQAFRGLAEQWQMELGGLLAEVQR